MAPTLSFWRLRRRVEGVDDLAGDGAGGAAGGPPLQRSPVAALEGGRIRQHAVERLRQRRPVPQLHGWRAVVERGRRKGLCERYAPELQCLEEPVRLERAAAWIQGDARLHHRL